MKITLYLVEGIFNFRLPSQISGSFSFDSEDVDDKLINIEARNGKWVLYSTADAIVVNSGHNVKEIDLLDNTFYTIKRGNMIYLIYASSLIDSKMNIYTSNQNSQLIIGNTNECNIKYNSIYASNIIVGVKYGQNNLIVQKEGNAIIYVNKRPVSSTSLNINYGDEIEIYGLRVIVLKNLVFISKLPNITINEMSANIVKLMLNSDASPEDIEVKDVDLYNKEDYASKAPRIRRLIDDKKIKIINPPAKPEQEELPALLVIGPMITMGIVSMVMVDNVVSKLLDGSTKLSACWPQLISSCAMLLSSLLWPNLTRRYQKKLKEKKEKELKEKYNKYLEKKEVELDNETKLERTIIQENLISLDECLDNIKKRNKL